MNDIKYRKNSAELPTVEELEEIFRQEAKRPIGFGKEREHFADFRLFIRWMELIGLSIDIFDKESTWQKIAIWGRKIQSQIVSKTLSISREGKKKEVENLGGEIAKYLGEEDIPQLSNVIFVFGSESLTRIKTAVDLYRRGLAPKIFISGGRPIYKGKKQPEAEVFKIWAVKHGISPKDIVIHTRAISVPDNVRGGLNMMDRLGMSYDSMILVTVWFAMRRSWAHMMKYVPLGTRLYRKDSVLSSTSSFRADGWWRNEVEVRVVFNEFIKLKISELLNSS